MEMIYICNSRLVFPQAGPSLRRPGMLGTPAPWQPWTHLAAGESAGEQQQQQQQWWWWILNRHDGS